MSNTTLNAMAVCPFWYDETQSKQARPSITCEGIYGRANKITFKNKSDRDAHAEQFCSSLQGCKQCEIYKLVNKKYKR